MSVPLIVDRILGDRPFAEVGEPVLAVRSGDRLAVAGDLIHESGQAPVAVYGVDDLVCQAVHRSRYPVHALAFHPEWPLLAIGTGAYDGGYFFKGELLLLDLGTGAVVSLIEHEFGRQVLGLEWLDSQRLRLLLAPSDDWEDRAARVEGHVVVLQRDDWRAVAPRSIDWPELAGPRGPAPRPDGRAEARRLLGPVDPRRTVRAVEQLADGRIVAALAGVAAECRLPSGEVQWSVPDEGGGGRDLVVTPDGRSVWVGLDRPRRGEFRQSLIRLSLVDGKRTDEVSPPGPFVLVQCGDGTPAIGSMDRTGRRGRLRIRRGHRIWTRETEHATDWLTAAEPAPPTAGGRPREAAGARRLLPLSWVAGETHFPGPGVELADGSLLYAGTVYHGHGPQPGGAFVIRRDPVTGDPRWTFRADTAVIALDADDETAYVAYRDGEVVALAVQDGSVRWRCRLPRIFPTAVTVTGPDRLLLGTSDGRIVDCRSTER
ncbi:PQQ-binding-like beta-propeller repeat protein [Actinoplanes sp. NPDC020271]|uniref:outer membrane protein assembly factor BamB family protein n=1 Tax=Actinoplanes sp. NPDC020271 TaxID=3363896 RepID=UPI0037A37108